MLCPVLADFPALLCSFLRQGFVLVCQCAGVSLSSNVLFKVLVGLSMLSCSFVQAICCVMYVLLFPSVVIVVDEFCNTVVVAFVYSRSVLCSCLIGNLFRVVGLVRLSQACCVFCVALLNVVEFGCLASVASYWGESNNITRTGILRWCNKLYPNTNRF